MAKINTTESTAKQPWAIGIVMRPKGQGGALVPTLVTSGNPNGRTATMSGLGDKQIFFFDPGYGRMKEADLITRFKADTELVEDFIFECMEDHPNYTREEIEGALSGRAAKHAKVASSDDVRARRLAAKAAAEG